MRQEFRHTTAKTRRQASALVTRPDLGRSIQHQAACCDLFINPHSICRKLPGRKGGFSCPKMGRTATSAQNPELERVAGAQLRRRLSAQKKTFIAPHRGSIAQPPILFCALTQGDQTRAGTAMGGTANGCGSDGRGRRADEHPGAKLRRHTAHRWPVTGQGHVDVRGRELSAVAGRCSALG